jgi:hypothetical protein
MHIGRYQARQILFQTRLRVVIAVLFMLLQSNALSNDQERVQAGGGVFTIEWQGEFSAEERSKMTAWLQEVATTVARLHGELPREQIRIVLKRYPSGSAVPFARVLRTGEQGIFFYVNPKFPLADFIHDWTAYHEFSHLFIPFPGRADIWFSEGLASYYQNILQYRAGLLDEAQTWQKLYEGFERGRTDNRFPDMNLDELSRRMRKTHAFMRIYWSGALYFLQTDMQLRAATDGQMTLDDVLKELGQCCLNEKRRWNGLEIAAEFDRIAAQDIFVPAYKVYERTLAIPEFVPTLEAAGVTVIGNDIRLDADNPPAHRLD